MAEVLLSVTKPLKPVKVELSEFCAVMVMVKGTPAVTLLAASPFKAIENLATPVTVTALESGLSIPFTVLVAVNTLPRDKSATL